MIDSILTKSIVARPGEIVDDKPDLPSILDLVQVTSNLSNDLAGLEKFWGAQLSALNGLHEQEKNALNEQLSTLQCQIQMLEKERSLAQDEAASFNLKLQQLLADLEHYFLLSQRQSDIINAHSRLQEKCILLALERGL
jgi:hypothetical protein